MDEIKLVSSRPNKPVLGLFIEFLKYFKKFELKQNQVKEIDSSSYVQLISILEESDRLKYRPFLDSVGEISERAKLVESYIRNFKSQGAERGAE